MKKKVLAIVLISIIFASCSRGLTPWQAAQGPQKCGLSHSR